MVHQVEIANIFTVLGTPLSNVSHYVYLGVSLDEHLKWNDHYNRIKNKFEQASYHSTQQASIAFSSTSTNSSESSNSSHCISKYLSIEADHPSRSLFAALRRHANDLLNIKKSRRVYTIMSLTLFILYLLQGTLGNLKMNTIRDFGSKLEAFEKLLATTSHQRQMVTSNMIHPLSVL